MSKRDKTNSNETKVPIATSIKEVQNAERRAKEIIQRAHEDQERIISNSKKRAAKIIEDAEASAREKSESSIKSAIKEAEQSEHKIVEHGSSEIKKRNIKTSKRGEELLAKQIAEMLLSE
jgi:V/A-type H+/Na+-transporting ATPase subunit G/H